MSATPADAVQAAPRKSRAAAMHLDPASRVFVLLAGAACLLPLLLQLPRTLATEIAIAALAIALGAWRRPLAGWVRVVLAIALTAAVLATMGFNFGRDTGCAMLAAMLAIKPAETDNVRDARSLLGFGLFAPFATFLLDQGPLSLHEPAREAAHGPHGGAIDGDGGTGHACASVCASGRRRARRRCSAGPSTSSCQRCGSQISTIRLAPSTSTRSRWRPPYSCR